MYFPVDKECRGKLIGGDGKSCVPLGWAVLSSLGFAKAASNYPLVNLKLAWHFIVKCFQFSEKFSSDVGYYHYHPIFHRV